MNKVIIVTGQTACGKSVYAAQLAAEIGGVVINSDAMQVYEETPIVSGSPMLSDSIEHCLYNTVRGDHLFSIKQWLDMVAYELNAATNRNLTPVIVGGSPMYNRLLVDGINEIPDISPSVMNLTQQMSNNEVYARLIEGDPLSSNIDKNNVHRVLRAYRVFLETGKSIYSFRIEPKVSYLKGYILDKRLLSISKDALHKNIISRFMQMIEQGAIEEVKALYDKGYACDLPIFKTIGVREIKEHLNGKIEQKEMVDQVVLSTMQYAKKQATWFNNKFKDFKQY